MPERLSKIKPGVFMGSIIFAVVCLLHGLIHLLGFLKAFNLAEIEALKRPLSKPAGFLWLVACVLFLAADIDFLLSVTGWWLVMAVAVVLSQVLIFSSWSDAKFGTFGNILLATGIILFLL